MNELLRAYRFQNPNQIPVNISIESSCWDYYGSEYLINILSSHQSLFEDFPSIIELSKNVTHLPWKTKGVAYIDSWGCEWISEMNGWTGIVSKPSLDTWDKLDSFVPPSFETQNGWGTQNWDDFEQQINKRKLAGKAVIAGLRHGHCFLTMTYMRGFENCIYDMFDEEPLLDKLLAMIQSFDMSFVNKILSYDVVDIVSFPEDLGTQNNSMISPTLFKKYIKPEYATIMKPVKDKGKLVYMHSDGLILDLIDDLIECGIDIINLQDMVNGIDNIQKYIKGRIAIDLDIDRQSVIPFGTPKDIDDLIHESVSKLWSVEGGLSLMHALEPNVPEENIHALLDSLEKHRNYKGK